jgi:hypothetical protein
MKIELKEMLNWKSSTETSSTERTDAPSIGASDGCRKIRRPAMWPKSVRLWKSSEATSEAPDEPMVSRETSVHWMYFVPETMSKRAGAKSLAPVESVMHRSIALV